MSHFTKGSRGKLPIIEVVKIYKNGFCMVDPEMGEVEEDIDDRCTMMEMTES
jgi:hypothetical protein